MSYNVYCLSYNNEKRKSEMTQRFNTLNIKHTFYQGVSFNDFRMNHTNNNNLKRVWSCMYGHLDMIKMFLEDNSVEFGIFCEDDIHIHTQFNEHVIRTIDEFKRHKLDVLLLGYLTPFVVSTGMNGFVPLTHCNNDGFSLYDYHDNLWGSQMFMISKEHAKTLLSKYDENSRYALRTLHDNTLTPFSADWTLTKDGKRALISPPLAVECFPDNNNMDINHHRFHSACFNALYKHGVYL